MHAHDLKECRWDTFKPKSPGREVFLHHVTIVAMRYAGRAKSGARAVHAILGGGDQLYNDNVWDLPDLKAWLEKPEGERLAYVPDKQMCDAVERAYLESYLSHTHFHPAAEFLRNTPQVGCHLEICRGDC
jgi:hypothetical protein